MTMTRLIAILLAVLAAATSLAASAQDKDEPEGGVLGTGIVGTITDLGSIYVNGQHILFDEDATVQSPLGNRSATTLVPGETVIVEAVPGANAWQARQIKAYLPLIGPVDSVSARSIRVLGVEVATPGGPAPITTPDGATVGEGDWIAVSGIWKEDTVTASRIEKIAPLPMASVVGSYRPGEAVEQVGAVRMLGIDLQHARPFDVLTVQGQPTADGLEVETVAVGLFSGPVGEVLFEGYLSQPDLAGAYTVEGSGMIAFVGSPAMAIDSTSRGLFCGRSDGVSAIERVLDLPNSTGARDDILRQFAGDGDPCASDAQR